MLWRDVGIKQKRKSKKKSKDEIWKINKFQSFSAVSRNLYGDFFQLFLTLYAVIPSHISLTYFTLIFWVLSWFYSHCDSRLQNEISTNLIINVQCVGWWCNEKFNRAAMKTFFLSFSKLGRFHKKIDQSSLRSKKYFFSFQPSTIRLMRENEKKTDSMSGVKFF